MKKKRVKILNIYHEAVCFTKCKGMKGAIYFSHTLEFRLDGTKINGENEASC